MPKRPLLGNHQKCWIRGRHAVAGVLRVGWEPYEVRIAETADPAAADEVTLTCEARGVPVIPSHAANLTKLCGGADHQGFAAKMPPFPYADAAGLFRKPPALTVVLDGVQDPHNLGAILRGAAEFGANA
ncbi:RNA methyltransferase substrate-binding domain-containing protein, partial [Alienimonas sp. DA493]|uniref:RNA methyltransferase substrate-binding domain-containing protein n=1 Tax=Alienimonas sp. DA493 TaxID=3373605 RepID=UPI00375462D6